MDILEILYAKEFKKVAYNVRKVTINSKKTLLLGPRGSGKSMLIHDYLSQKDKGSYLYIDFNDFRLQGIDIEKYLKGFLKKHNISTLVFENFDFSFEIPPSLESIVTTDRECSIDGFDTLTLFPLDFEEFISFDKRELNIEATFNSFAIKGTFPAMQKVSKENFVSTYQEFLNKLVKDRVEMTLLQLLSLKQGAVVSIYGLFLEAKRRQKISKDRFYNFIKRVQDEYIIFLVEKFEHKKSPKKLYLIDFSIRGVLNFEKDFIKRFENILFLELVKRKKSIYYTDIIDFYIPSEKKAILPMPFLPQNIIVDRLNRLKSHFKLLEVKTVQIVTLEANIEYEDDGILYEILPFWSFATSI